MNKIEIKRKDNFVMPLTRWATGELMNEDIIDTYDVLDLPIVNEDEDELDVAIGKWFPMTTSGEFMLSQCKFEGKIEIVTE